MKNKIHNKSHTNVSTNFDNFKSSKEKAKLDLDCKLEQLSTYPMKLTKH